MIAKFKYIILFLMLSSKLFTQGFDWQYSYRMPSESPILFIGLSAGAGYLSNTGSVDFTENFIPCCQFEDGSGLGTNFSVYSEYWYSGLIALSAKLGVSTTNSTFQVDGEPIPRRTDTIHTQYNFVSKITYFNLNLGAKHRLFKSHLSAGVGLNLGILVSSTAEYKEKVISPDYYTFRDGTQERSISRGKIDELNSITLTPQLYLGYDLNISRGMYATPYISIGIPLANTAQNSNWKIWNFSIGINLLRGIFI